MAHLFAYTVRTSDGRLIQGEMEAAEAKAVASYLWGQNYVIVNIEPRSVSWLDQDILALFKRQSALNWLTGKVKAKDLAFFCRQLGTMLNSGVALLSALRVLRDQKGSPKLRDAIGRLIEELEQGNSFADGSRKSADIFPPIFINMVEAGEMGGALDEVLHRLANQFDKEHELTEKVKSAMTYPIIIFFVAVVAIGFMLGFILPKFTVLLDSFNVDLPWFTKVILQLSHLTTQYWYLVLGLILVILLGAKQLLKHDQNKLRFDSHLLRVPIFGELIRKREIARFTRTLATLLRSGVPILQALEVVKHITNNLLIQRTLENAKVSIRDGEGVAAPLSQSQVFPAMVIQMIRTGEETGNLEDMLEKVSSFFDQEVDAVVGRLSSLIEPIFIVTLGVTIGFMLLAILLPVFKVITAVQ